MIEEKKKVSGRELRVGGWTEMWDRAIDKATDLAIGQSKWRNLLFTKNGNSHLGCNLFESKDSAKKRIGKLETEIKEILSSGKEAIVPCLDGNIKGSQYSWSMQVPIVEV